MRVVFYNIDCGVQLFSGEVNLDESCSDKDLPSIK